MLARRVVLLVAVFALIVNLRADHGSPVKSIRLSAVLAQLSQDPDVREKILQSLDNLPNAWGLIGEAQRARLRDFILNRNWAGVDHFPAITVAELTSSVSVANAAAARYQSLTSKLDPPYVEVGSFSTDRGGEVAWGVPEHESQTPASPPVKDLGHGLTSGDPLHPELWKWHGQSLRAAQLLNRLSLNSPLYPERVFRVRVGEQVADSPQGLISLLAHTGSDLWIEDSRYFANFGHLHWKGEDVVMPFWLDTNIPVPRLRTNLIVPVSHAEEEIRIRGTHGNADVSFYFGIDGMTEFRTMDTLDQYWVGKNVAHTYRDAQAMEVTRLLGQALSAYAGLQSRYPNVPFHGYYRFGVCQDAVAAIEMRMHGQTTLFPITHDPQYFAGSSEVDTLFQRLPNDRRGTPEWRRIRGSLPVKNLSDLQIPELRENLELVTAAQGEGWTLRQSLWMASVIAALLASAAYLGTRARQHSREHPKAR